MAGLAPEPAVGLAHIISARRKMLLQLVAFRAREHAFVPWPSLHEGLAAAQPIGEMADGERIGFGRVVFHDHAEILQHQEAWPLRARRDRKSTRLNSSHLGISYAVFCLKKKK